MEENDLQSLQNDLEDEGQKISHVNLLFLDLSSSCTGYSVVEVDFTTKSANFKKAGALWLPKDISNQEKYHYLFKTICDYFYIIDKIDYCVAEAYMINTKKMMGSQVGPELHGAIQVALAEVGVKYANILTQTWRAQLGIKPIKSTNNKGKTVRDFKTPTINYVDSKIPNIPKTILSNITKKSRQTPNDLYDSLAISMGFLTKLGIKKWNVRNIEIQSDVIL